MSYTSELAVIHFPFFRRLFVINSINVTKDAAHTTVLSSWPFAKKRERGFGAQRNPKTQRAGWENAKRDRGPALENAHSPDAYKQDVGYEQ